jgi:hypothetical protein
MLQEDVDGRDKPDHDGNMEAPMKRFAVFASLALIAALPLAGCISVEERRAITEAQDDADCRNFGAKPGTATYVRCRTDLRQARAQEAEARRPVVVSTSVVAPFDPFWGPSFVGPVGPVGPRFCRNTAWGLRCY